MSTYIDQLLRSRQSAGGASQSQSRIVVTPTGSFPPLFISTAAKTDKIDLRSYHPQITNSATASIKDMLEAEHDTDDEDYF